MINVEEITNKDGFHITANLPGTSAGTAANYDVFFQPRYACAILWVGIRHATAGTDGSAVTLNLEVLDDAETKDSGDTVLVTAYDLKGTVDTQTEYKGVTALQNTTLIKGQALALKDSGTLTSVAGVQVTVYFKYLGRGDYR